MLEPLPGGRTRLIERPAPTHGLAHVFSVLLVELPHFVMQQAMFRGIRRRAEAQPGFVRRSSSSSAAAREAASSAARSLAA